MSKRSLAILVALSSTLVACVAASDSVVGEDEGSRSRPIIGGSKATAYPEAVLVDMYQNGQLAAYCSGSLIAPKVVLTAGHCVFQFSSWKIKAPFASNQTATASSGTTLDWTNTSESVDPNMHDIGLIFLDTAITIATYPTLATSPLADNSQVVNLGRINNGALSTTALYVSQPITVKGAASSGFPFDYTATDKIESGDSGGPDEASGTHTIVAVNSGAGSGTEVLARVDLVSTWIQQQIASHGGGGGSGGGGGAGGSGGAGGAGGSGAGGSGAGGAGGSGGACSHAICASGGKLTSTCDPCAAQVCASDSYCCSTSWDSQCVGEVASICGQTCGGGTGGSGGSGGSASCGNVTYEGKCVGNTVEWCDGGLQKLKCTGGHTCGLNQSEGYYDCL